MEGRKACIVQSMYGCMSASSFVRKRKGMKNGMDLEKRYEMEGMNRIGDMV
jgi:hypothetical protein